MPMTTTIHERPLLTPRNAGVRLAPAETELLQQAWTATAPAERPTAGDGPAVNRVLNAWYGEARNFAADRAVAQQLAGLAPALPVAARHARRSRHTALRAAFSAGVSQVLDLGAGIPTGDGDPLPGTVHGRDVRAAYIDQDPVAVAALRAAYARRSPLVVAEAADLTAPGPLLDGLTGRGAFDPAAPALLILSLILHHLADFQALHLLGVLQQRLAPGSRLLVTAFVADPFPADVRDRLTDWYPAAPQLVLRTAAQTSALLHDAGWPAPARAVQPGLYTAALRHPIGGPAA
ncbi:SAM-dependent methyltransferase [Dactylosporangium matsuzakiense]|uniref:S-adenosyl methyltransferase n=1 Tax=Dactylosporangium matsuzakiense TaxID=53360 RepID=A0A9W6KU21_9ACTN|nr:SAM-dependent methyltransferase [Dactylosporangium matsuzakiense]GLL07222.1 hypothetical protein GCM10017581_089740 [Dactylosporangium matsuzakiense]